MVLPDLLPEVPQLLDITEKRCVTGYQVRKGLSGNWYRMAKQRLKGVRYTVQPKLISITSRLTVWNIMELPLVRRQQDIGEISAKEPDYQETTVTVNNTDLSKELDWAIYSAGKLVSPLLYNIRRERRCELLAEGLRMLDLKRWRALDQVKQFVIEGVNLWESDLKDKYMQDGKKSSDTGRNGRTNLQCIKLC